MTARRKVALILVGLASLGTLLLMGHRERPLLEPFFFDYKVLHSVRDQNTGKVVELGVLSNFGSTEYEVGVYDNINNERSAFELRKQNISIVGYPGPVPELIQFDGRCYFLTTPDWRKDWDRISPTWRDEASGKEICFYALTAGNEKIGG